MKFISCIQIWPCDYFLPTECELKRFVFLFNKGFKKSGVGCNPHLSFSFCDMNEDSNNNKVLRNRGASAGNVPEFLNHYSEERCLPIRKTYPGPLCEWLTALCVCVCVFQKETCKIFWCRVQRWRYLCKHPDTPVTFHLIECSCDMPTPSKMFFHTFRIAVKILPYALFIKNLHIWREKCLCNLKCFTKAFKCL